MKELIFAVLLVSATSIAVAEKKMQNTNPSPEPVVEPVLGHHMQNRNPNPTPETPVTPAPEHVMQNANPTPVPVPEHVMKNTNPN